jgi:hypothetical protein
LLIKLAKNKIFLIFTAILFSFALFIVCLDPIILYKQTVFYIFQSRDLERARNLLQGHLIFFGPEMTGGGYLPGPLYYYLLSIGMTFKANWIGAWYMQLTLAYLAAVSGLVYFTRKFSSLLMGLLWLIIFVSAPFTFRFLQLFLNVSSMLIFAVGAIMFIDKAFSHPTYAGRKKGFLIACLLIGFGIQLHFSLIVYFIALVFLHLFGQKLSLHKLSGKDFLYGVILFIVPSTPYIIWAICHKLGISVGQQGFYNPNAFEALKSVFFITRFSLGSSWSDLFGIWHRNIVFTVPFPFVVLLLAQLITRVYLGTKTSLSSYAKLKPILICLCFSFIPFLDWFFSPQAMRYSMPLYICLIFLTTIVYRSVLDNEEAVEVFNWIGGMFLIVFIFLSNFVFTSKLSPQIFLIYVPVTSTTLFVCYFFDKKIWDKGRTTILSLAIFIGLVFSQKYLLYTSYFYVKSTGNLPNYSQISQVWSVISSETGWSYKEASKKIYYINNHMEYDPQMVLETLDIKQPVTALKNITNIPNGFFVSTNFHARKVKTKADYLNWLLMQNLQSDVKKELESGKIKIGDNLSSSNLVIPFWIKDSFKIASSFHNVGEGYRLTSDDKILSRISQREGAVKMNSSSFLFKWNECPDQNLYCSTGAVVDLIKKREGVYLINIKIVGGTISQISPWVSPGWTQAWIAPFLEIDCNDVKTKLEIASSIGFNRKYPNDLSTPVLLGNNSFVGPFERLFNFSCKGSIKKISFGRKGSTVDQIRNVLLLDGKILTLEM